MWLYVWILIFCSVLFTYLDIKVSANLISMQQVAMTSVDHFGENIIIRIGENLKSRKKIYKFSILLIWLKVTIMSILLHEKLVPLTLQLECGITSAWIFSSLYYADLCLLYLFSSGRHLANALQAHKLWPNLILTLHQLIL